MDAPKLTCPKCGSTNKPGRHACWNCWAQLPEQPPISARALPRRRTPADEPRPFYFGTRSRASDIDTAPAAPEAPAAPVWGDEPAAPEPAPAPATPRFVPADGPVLARRPTSPLWLLVLLAALIALTAAMALVWRMGFAMPMRQSDAAGAARGYLLALERGDAAARRTATSREDAPGALPAWLAVGTVSAVGPVLVEGDRAEVRLTLPLVPRRSDALAPEARAAVARDHQVRVPLRAEDGVWRVREGEFVRLLRAQMLEGQPAVAAAWPVVNREAPARPTTP